jgi:hypothetical protein
MNFSYHEPIGTYPAKLLFGDTVTPNRGLVTEWSSIDGSISNQEYIVQLDEQLKNIIAASQEHQRKVVAERLKKSPENPTKFEVGQYVLVSYPDRPPDKLHGPGRGPLLITEIQNQTYWCRDLISNQKHPFFIDRLTLYNSGSLDSTPQEVALLDPEKYNVEEIIDHRGKLTKSKIQFRVKWIGFDSSENTWEPFKNLKNNIALNAYFAKHPKLMFLNK